MQADSQTCVLKSTPTWREQFYQRARPTGTARSPSANFENIFGKFLWLIFLGRNQPYSAAFSHKILRVTVSQPVTVWKVTIIMMQMTINFLITRPFIFWDSCTVSSGGRMNRIWSTHTTNVIGSSCLPQRPRRPYNAKQLEMIVR